MLETDQQLLKFNQQIQQALQEKKSVEAITLHYENKNPEYVTDIKIKPLQPNSKLFKDFKKKISFVQAIIEQENKFENWWSFIYTAMPKEDEKSQGQKPKEVAP
jgi:hypothetical protein